MRKYIGILLFLGSFMLQAQDCATIRDCFMDAYNASDYKKMQEIYARAEQESATDSAKAYMQTGIGLIMNDNRLFEECRPYLLKAMELDPDRAEDALVGLGNSYLNQRNYSEAISYYDQVIAMNEKSVQGWYFKGLAYYYQQKDDEALKAMKEAQKLIPVRTIQGTGDNAIVKMQIGDTSIPLFMRANIHYHVALLTSDNVMAINETNKALVDDPNHGKALYERGKRRYFLQQYPDGISDLSAAVEGSERDNKFAWYYLGMANYYSKNYANAANSLAQARTVGPPFYTAVYYEGMAIWYYSVDHKDQWSDLYPRIKNSFEYVIANSDDTKLVEKARKSLYDLNN